MKSKRKLERKKKSVNDKRQDGIEVLKSICDGDITESEGH